MGDTKKSFVIHLDMLNVLDELDDKQAGRLLKAIREYQLRLGEKDHQDTDAEDDWAVNDFVTKIVFAPFKAQFDRDYSKWVETSEKNRKNAHKRWDNSHTKNATRINRIPNDAKNADNDSDNVNVNEREISIARGVALEEEGHPLAKESVLQKSNLFAKPKIPTLEEVKLTFAQQGGTEEMAERFYQKHSATGWFLNNSPIRNYASLVGGYIDQWRRNEQKGAKFPIKTEREYKPSQSDFDKEFESAILRTETLKKR